LRHLILSILLFTQLLATMILNLNVHESSDKVDLTLNFDVPYTGALIKKRSKDRIDLLLKKVTILAPWQKKLSSPLVYQIEAKPVDQGTLISFYTTTDPKLFAARSKDGYSLKIELRSATPTTAKEPQSKEEEGWGDMLAIGTGLLGILLGGWLLLALVKRPKIKESKRIIIESPRNQEFRIIFEKPLDEQNKIALIAHKGVNYLVIIGSTNVLLGKYKEGEIETHEDFERAIESQDIAKAMEPRRGDEEILTTIEEYKRRASGNL